MSPKSEYKDGPSKEEQAGAAGKEAFGKQLQRFETMRVQNKLAADGEGKAKGAEEKGDGAKVRHWQRRGLGVWRGGRVGVGWVGGCGVGGWVGWR